MGIFLLKHKIICTFVWMFRLVYIALFWLCSFMFGQQCVAAPDSPQCEKRGADIVASQYAVQLECAHRCNNTAQQTHSIVVPATTSTTLATRARLQHKAESCVTAPLTAGAKVNFSILFSLYRVCCKRAIDFYLYALCCLRL